VVIPAYNEEDIIGQVVRSVRKELEAQDREFEVLVIDDGSTDHTAREAEGAGACVLRHAYNVGNGAAVKRGIRHATGEVIVLMDGDGQHAATDIPRFLEAIGPHQMVVGSRTDESEGSWHRDLANKVYSALASYVVGHRVDDLTSGFRAVDAAIAKSIVYLLPNGFSYPSTMTIALFRSGHTVRYLPIKASARIGKSKIRLLRDGLGFLLIVIRIGTFFAPMRLFLPAALLTFLPGFLYAIYRLILGRPWTIPIVLSLLIGLLIFALGLISEQIALLRMDRSENGYSR
jgi:glycosyltransferase involved in cell wall biosynthesis